MSLRCAFREVHGACEPELIALDRYEALRVAVLDAVGGTEACRCFVPVPAGTCYERVAGLVDLPEAGWVFACEWHVLLEDDPDKAIELRRVAVTR